MEDIFKVKQGDTELLREFVDRFQREKMMLPQVLDNWAAMAFASNLNKKISEATRRLKESLREFSTTTWNDVYNRYNTKLQIEEDIVARSRVDERTKSRRSRNRDAGSSSRFRKERDACDRDTNTNARIGDYSFNISTSELVAILRSMGDKVRWTKEMRSNPGRRSPDFWCEFHNDHGHKTADCRLLQGEVEHLLKQVNVISGGEEVNGVTYTATKKTSKFTVTHGKQVRQVLEEDSITFDDADGLIIPHNDALIISLLIHDTNVKRVLIDLGSSVNIILLRVVNEMQMGDKIVPKARSLSGFDNSIVITKGEIVLTTFVEGVIKDTKF
ncbi:uncharacterized protein [Nicotiana tomentosiformis]|uniref:uncharacterized protein n=1 Tax=Nicotiana tomentosiformis TaxID=4098 RepID=UPI00388CC6BD